MKLLQIAALCVIGATIYHASAEALAYLEQQRQQHIVWEEHLAAWQKRKAKILDLDQCVARLVSVYPDEDYRRALCEKEAYQ